MQVISDNIHCNNVEAFKALLAPGEEAARSPVKVGVIFEGGALRGVLSCGYGRALAELLPLSKVHAVYGSSSGALNSIYFLTEELEVAHSIYVENATDKRCTNIWNFPNILNVDWLLDTWIFGAKQFNWSKVHGSRIKAVISLTAMTDGAPRYIDATTTDFETLNKAMKATSYAPLLTNATQWIEGVECGDGAIADAIPYQKALADGCTHVICLLTRPKEYRKGEGRFFGKWFKYLRLGRQTRTYRKAYWEGERQYNALMAHLYSGDASVPTLIVSPAGPSELPHNIETDPAVINEKGERAYKLAKSQFAMLFP